MNSPDPNTDLAQLLASAVSAVVEAQDVLDEHAERQRVRYAETPSGTLAVPPLWYAFRRVGIDVELTAEFERELVQRNSESPATLEPRLKCRVLNPTTVGLYGYRAASGLKVHLTLEPQGLPQIRVKDPAPSEDSNHA